MLEKTKLVPNFGTKLVPKFGTIFGSHSQNTVVFSVRKRRAKRKPFAGGTDGGHHVFWGGGVWARATSRQLAQLIAAAGRAALTNLLRAPRVRRLLISTRSRAWQSTRASNLRVCVYTTCVLGKRSSGSSAHASILYYASTGRRQPEQFGAPS